MDILKVDSISKNYRKNQVLNNVSFTARKGDCIGVVGANGCGKSTLLGILSGCVKPGSGSVNTGPDTTIGYVPQDNPLFENLTVRDNLRLWYSSSGKSIDEACESLSFFKLNDFMDMRVSRLSGGMKKRLSIACSLANQPNLLIMDEPGASLDIVCKNDICHYIRSFISDGGTVIISSHEDLELSICNRMILISSGTAREIKPVTGEDLIRLLAREE